MGCLLTCEQCASLNKNRPREHRYLKAWLQLVRLFVEVRRCSRPGLSMTAGAGSESKSLIRLPTDSLALAVKSVSFQWPALSATPPYRDRLFSLWNHKPQKTLSLKLPWSQCFNKAKQSNSNGSPLPGLLLKKAGLPRQLQSPLNNWPSGSTGSTAPLNLSQPHTTVPAAPEAFTEL